MPYKVMGKCVYVKRPSGWVRKECHKSRALAIKHMTALNLAMLRKEGRKGIPPPPKKRKKK